MWKCHIENWKWSFGAERKVWIEDVSLESLAYESCLRPWTSMRFPRRKPKDLLNNLEVLMI